MLADTGDRNPFLGWTAPMIAEALGFDLRAPTKPIVQMHEVASPGNNLHLDKWPCRRRWPGARRLYALWRWESEGNKSAAAATRASLDARGHNILDEV